MARSARIVAPGYPHLIVQRGNNGHPAFHDTEDYRNYKDIMRVWCQRCGVEVWAYALVPGEARMIVVPQDYDSLRRAIGEAHRRYSVSVNNREGNTGHVWRGRFGSCPLDDRYLVMAACQLETLPVRLGHADSPADYTWSSAGAHLQGRDDDLCLASPLLERAADWKTLLATPIPEEARALINQHARTGRPLGSSLFISKLERLLHKDLRPKKPGRKPGSTNKPKPVASQGKETRNKAKTEQTTPTAPLVRIRRRSR